MQVSKQAKHSVSSKIFQGHVYEAISLVHPQNALPSCCRNHFCSVRGMQWGGRQDHGRHQGLACSKSFTWQPRDYWDGWFGYKHDAETAATEYNYIYFRYNNQWVTGKLISYEVVDNGQNIKFTVEGNSDASYYTSMANVVLMHKDENNTRTQNIYEKLAEGTTYGWCTARAICNWLQKWRSSRYYLWLGAWYNHVPARNSTLQMRIRRSSITSIFSHSTCSSTVIICLNWARKSLQKN